MARWSYLIVAVYVLLAVGYAQEESVTGTAAVADSNTTTTTPTTTTAPSTTTITTAPTTTTNATTTKATTTTKTTTTTTKTTTTTPSTTSTTAASTTTGKPEPQPDWPRNIGRWFVNGTDTKANVTCLAFSAAMQIDVVNKSKTAHVVVPTNAKSSGTCGENEVTIVITWESNSVKLTFAKNVTTEKSALRDISVDVTVPNEPEINTNLSGQTLFEAPANRSYKCTKETSVKLTDTNVELKVASLQVEAFRVTPFENYSSATECAIDDVSPVVPLAVGISLAVLVVIVLIAYLIGRSRSRARGYQSV